MKGVRDVELVSWQKALERLSQAVRSLVPENGKLRVIEAGCGRNWGLDVDRNDCFITGIDMDRDALEARISIHSDIDRPIVGDIQDAEIVDSGSSDLVYSAYVLEHLPLAEQAAKQWISWLDQSGALILVVPDANSAYGYLARRTPHRFHVWVYRHVFGLTQAGTPGHGPYRVSYSRLMTVEGLLSFADENGLEVDMILAIGNAQEHIKPLRRWLIVSAKRALNLISGNRLSWRHDNIAVVLRKSG